MGKRHHYVPQCYLRKFSSNGKTVKYYDKTELSLNEDNIDEVCQIENMYYLKHSDNPNEIELDFFSYKEENALGNILNSFLNLNNSSIDFNKDRRVKLSRQIVLQYIRTPMYRDIKSDNELNAIYPQLIYLFSKIGFDIEEIHYEGDKAHFHKNLFLENDVIDEIVSDIADCEWELLKTQQEFYTSDNPIVINRREDMPVTYCDAIKFFADIYYPLNSHLLLHIIAKEHSSLKLLYVKNIDSLTLSKINKLIAENAKKYVFYKNSIEL